MQELETLSKIECLKEKFYPKNYNYYGKFLKNKFDSKVYKIVVDAGFTCPNRDGSKGFGGCTYCNVDSFTPSQVRAGGTISEQVERGMERAKSHYKAEKFIIYFQPNTNTYASVETLQKHFDEALSVNSSEIVGLSVGTRPDCIDEEKIQLFKKYSENLNVCLEYGMESMYDETLLKINRGHLHEDFAKAMELTEGNGIDICVHTVFGFPNETEEQWLKVADELNKFEIDFVKLHHLHIVKGSKMAWEFKNNPFPLFTLEGYTNFLCKFLPKLKPEIVVQRLFGISDWDELIAPNWGMKKTLIQNYIEKTLEKKNIFQGMDF
ncbi:MAG: TIGR01212 family radical SAM protein [Calditrichaeota bacterium]|nr:MAG: TIGR01212 family radical SAM protein [Calditrichota bacterium]